MSTDTQARDGSYIWFMREIPIFREQTESFYHSADLRARLLEFKRGDPVDVRRSASGNIYIVVEGQIKLRSLTENGKEIIIDVLGSGDAFGPIDRAVRIGNEDSGTISESTIGETASEAVALSEGSVLKFPLDYFKDLIQRRPTVVFNLTRVLGTRQRRLEIRLRRLLFRTSLGKVAGLLTELAERYGEPDPDSGGILISFRLRHQEMASIIGTKRETVSESLAELELRELIVSSRSKLVVLKPEELDRIA